MASSHWTTMKSPLTSVEKGDFTPIKRPVIFPLQVKCEKGHKLRTTKNLCISRRDMMHSLTAQVLGLTFLSKRAEGRKKIMEKLEELKQKIGKSRPKTQNENGNSSTKPSPNDNKSPEINLTNIPASNDAV